MYSAEKQLKMLASNKASVRYDACEWIRVSQESSPQIVTALEKATHDADIEVAERAALALQADVHHQMAIKIGMIEIDKTETPLEPVPSSAIGNSKNEKATNESVEPLVTPQGWKAKYRAWPLWRKILFWTFPSLAILVLLGNLSVDHVRNPGYKIHARPATEIFAW